MGEVRCCGCGVIFNMPDPMIEHRKRDHKLFYCPNGHSQNFPQQSDIEKLQDIIKEKENSITTLINELRREEMYSSHLERRIRSLKGVITRLKRGKK